MDWTGIQLVWQLDGNLQSIDRAELKSTLIMPERGAKRIHTDSMYVIGIWRKVTKFLRERGKFTGAQLQNTRTPGTTCRNGLLLQTLPTTTWWTGCKPVCRPTVKC